MRSGKISLNEKQRAEVRSILAAERVRIELLIAQMAKNQRQVRNAMESGLLDKTALRTLRMQRAQLESDLALAKQSLRAKVRNALRVEQLEEANVE